MNVFRLSLALVPLAVAACAGPQSAGTYQTAASYNQVYAASLNAVSSIGFTVTSSNRTDGMIIASQGVMMGGGSAVGLNAHVSEGPNGLRTLQVNIAAPPGTLALGDFNDNLTKYVSTVRMSANDLRPAP